MQIQREISALTNLFVKAGAEPRACRTNGCSWADPSQRVAGGPVGALISAQLRRNPPELACRADPGSQRNPGSVRNFWTYPPALNSTARLRHTVAELPESRFQPCAPRAAILSTSQARAADMRQRPPHFLLRSCAIAHCALRNPRTESVDFACTPPTPRHVIRPAGSENARPI